MPYDSGEAAPPKALPQDLVNAVAGFGGPIAAAIRDKLGIHGGVDPCSSAYKTAEVLGAVQRMFSGGAALFKGHQLGMFAFSVVDGGNAVAGLYLDPSEVNTANVALVTLTIFGTGSIVKNGDTVSRSVAALMNVQSGTVGLVATE